MKHHGTLSGDMGPFEIRRWADWLFALVVFLAVNYGTEIIGVLKSSEGWRAAVSAVVVVLGRGVYVYLRDYSTRYEVT